MSFHAIEDLVEDSIRMVDSAVEDIPEKRLFFYNLYQFQYLFDTSDTVMRCADVLKKSGYLVENPKAGAKGERPYIEFGSPLPWSTPDLVLRLLRTAERADDLLLMKNFYLAFVNEYLEGTLDEASGIPADFGSWLSNEMLLEIRKLFVEHKLLSLKKKETSFELLRLSDELELANSPARRAQVLFLMDPRKEVSTIQKDYEKNLRLQEERPKKMEALDRRLLEEASKYGWEFIEKANDSNWLWYTDSLGWALGKRLFIEFRLDNDLKGIYIRFYVQHPTISGWQGKKHSTQLKDTHFSTSLGEFLSPDEAEQYLNFMGLWDVHLNHSLRTIERKSALAISSAAQAGARYLKKIDKEFPEKFYSRDIDHYIGLFESDGVISQFLLSSDLKNILLLFIHRAMLENQIEKARHYAEIFEARASAGFKERNDWYKNEVKPYLDAIQMGEQPLLIHLNLL